MNARHESRKKSFAAIIMRCCVTIWLSIAVVLSVAGQPERLQRVAIGVRMCVLAG
jgi:hypothetical protein